MAESTGGRPGDITILIGEAQQGNRQAEDELFSRVYDELKRIAAGRLRLERSGHSLQPSELIHHAFLKLRGMNRLHYRDRRHLFRVAGHIMRQVLWDLAKARGAGKRGSGVDPDPISLHPVIDAKAGIETNIFALREALETLARIDPRSAQVVECRYFSGLSLDETAAVVGISKTSVKRSWDFGRAWLRRELNRPPRR